MIPFSKKSYATQISELVFDHKRKKCSIQKDQRNEVMKFMKNENTCAGLNM
jgi:hypothetical protein